MSDYYERKLRAYSIIRKLVAEKKTKTIIYREVMKETAIGIKTIDEYLFRVLQVEEADLCE